MVGSPHPHPHLYYHGTRAEFGPGGVILSGDYSAWHEYDPDDPPPVLLTTDFDTAKKHARKSKVRYRPRVLAVIPTTPTEVTQDEKDPTIYYCSAAKVVSIVWQKGTHAEEEQATA